MSIKTSFGRFRGLRKSRSVSELMQKLELKDIYTIAFIPAIVLAAAPLVVLIWDSVFPPEISGFNSYHTFFTYAYVMMSVFWIAAIFALLALIFYVGKSRQMSGQKLSSFLAQTFRENKTLMWFSLFIVWMLISTTVNGFTHEALFGDMYRRESIFVYMLYFAGYFVCGMLIKNSAQKRKLIYFLLAVSLVIGVCVMLDTWTGISMPAFKWGVGTSAVFHQFNHYGYFLLISILLSSTLMADEDSAFARIFCLIVFLANNIVLIVNDTFGCYLAVFIALIFQNIYFICSRKKVSVSSVISIVLFFAVSFVMGFWYDTIFSNITTFFTDIEKVADSTSADSQDTEAAQIAQNAGTGRWTLWTHTATYISEKPVFGFGTEGIRDRLAEETNNCNNRPHNEFLTYAAFYGIPALVFYLCGVMTVFFRAWKQRKRADKFTAAAVVTAFGYLVSSFFGNTMYYTAPFFFLILGMAYSKAPESDVKCAA